jgi:hypothetical protein
MTRMLVITVARQPANLAPGPGYNKAVNRPVNRISRVITGVAREVSYSEGKRVKNTKASVSRDTSKNRGHNWRYLWGGTHI